jgi:D-threo-aldose 1-dehydrogenase
MALSPALRARLAANAPALGGAPLGNLYRALDDATAAAVLGRALALGVTYFDTAPHYGHGRSEERMGATLRRLARERFVLSTKVGRVLEPATDVPRDQHGYVATLPFRQRYDYTADGVRRSLDDSLARLGVDRVDLVYVHDIDQAMRGTAHAGHWRDLLDSGLPALARLKAEGAIGGYGLGVNDVGICLATLAHADLDVLLLAGRYTLADQAGLPELLPLCLRRDVAVVLGGPYKSGILATGAHPADGTAPYFDYAPAPAAVVARVEGLETVCRAYDVPLQAAALQFPRAHPAIACVLAGARTAREVEQNCTLARLPIPGAFWSELRARELVAQDAPLPAEAP